MSTNTTKTKQLSPQNAAINLKLSHIRGRDGHRFIMERQPRLNQLLTINKQSLHYEISSYSRLIFYFWVLNRV